MKLSDARIILPRIHRAMMSITAYDLIGIQPMSAPTGLVYTLKTRYSSSEDQGVMLGKYHFKYFLRIYNRRKSHKLAYIRKLGYPVYQTTDYTQWNAALLWCVEHLEKGAFISTPAEIIFANQSDYLEFQIVIG